MTDNYTRVTQKNLETRYAQLPGNLANNLPAEQKGSRFTFKAFGETCTIEPGEIRRGKDDFSTVLGIIISLYALNARSEPCIPEPFNAFKALPGSRPYVGPFPPKTIIELIEDES